MTDSLSALGVRCFHCGNVASKRRPLRWEGERGASIVVHEWAPCDESRGEDGTNLDDADMPVCGHAACDELWPCPEPPDGWGVCARCREAGPVVNRRPHRGEVAAAVIVQGGTERSTTQYGASVLPVFVHALRCPKDDRERDRAGARIEAHKVEREDEQASADTSRADAVPTDGAGVSIGDLSALWGMKERATRNTVGRLVEVGVLRFDEVATRSGGAPRKVYWRVVE